MRDIIIAENAGFCFGVKRATDFVGELMASEKSGRIYTLGSLIHNRVYNESLAAAGVVSIGADELEKIAQKGERCSLVIRTHGIEKRIDVLIKELSQKHPDFKVYDMTCPYVKRIHKIAEENTDEDTLFILIGTAHHPEVEGIMSYAKGEKQVFSSAEELLEFAKKDSLLSRRVVAVSQTTQKLSEWKKCQEIIEKVYTNALIFDTICNVTENRQTEVQNLSRECDCMIVVGGKESSNTAKLYEICKKNCHGTVWVETADELVLSEMSTFAKVGITAGASTPRGIIEEVYRTMSEMENFAELLEESLNTLNTGDIVRGTVVAISANEIDLDLGAKVSGIIKREQITDDPAEKLEELFKVGDEVEAFVIRVSDVEGIAELSKKRVDLNRNWDKLVAAYENGEILEGKVTGVVKGGVTISLFGVRVFIPGAHTGIAKDGDLSVLVGTTQRVKVIELKPQRKHAYASIRDVLREERRALEEKFWESAEVGKKYSGVVKSLTTYGAFVDLGGIDGMVHNTELSWKRIKHPSEVVSIGDTIEVTVKDLDREKNRISLSYKTEEMNSWYQFCQQFKIGDVTKAKIVSMMPFGAFAEILDGCDGLIHISQIADRRIAKPDEVLTIGEEVDVKIIDVDYDAKRISLSIRALLEPEAEAVAEEAVEAVEAAEEATDAE